MEETNSNYHVGETLIAMNKTLSLAESCTGGMVSKIITDSAGSSQFFIGAVIAYSDEVKTGILKVDQETLKIHGAVSEPVAVSMARGVKSVLKSDIGASCTGIAGPGGSTTYKPVGLVCMAVCDDHDVKVETKHFAGDRDAVRTASSNHLLKMISEFIRGHHNV